MLCYVILILYYNITFLINYNLILVKFLLIMSINSNSYSDTNNTQNRNSFSNYGTIKNLFNIKYG